MKFWLGEEIMSGMRTPVHSKGARAVAFLVFWALLGGQATAIPVCLGFAFLSSDARPMTRGCDKKTCCTALCYLDKNGVHHCVHRPGDSCECTIAETEPQSNPILLSVPAILPDPALLLTETFPTGWMDPVRTSVISLFPATPTPPPK